jgi:hypothetical protein
MVSSDTPLVENQPLDSRGMTVESRNFTFDATASDISSCGQPTHILSFRTLILKTERGFPGTA